MNRENIESIASQEIEVNFWPSFIDIIASMLMVFILISFLRLVLNFESLELLVVKSRQEQFEIIFREEFYDEIHSGKIRIQTIGNLQQLTFSSEILFEKGSAAVSYKGRILLSRLANLFKQAETIAKFKQIQVEGHTDNIPISSRLKHKFASNWELSSQRAINVVKYFSNSKKHHLDSALFSGTGYAEYKPVVPNISDKNRALNRRIEIRLVYFSDLHKREITYK